MLNRRHKVILFVTLVTMGSALLAGASLGEGLGIFILGIAFAWVVGSDTASGIFDSARRVPGKTWPWLRVLLWMALGGCLLVAVAIESNFNSFLVISSIAIFGMPGCVGSRDCPFPSRRFHSAPSSSRCASFRDPLTDGFGVNLTAAG